MPPLELHLRDCSAQLGLACVLFQCRLPQHAVFVSAASSARLHFSVPQRATALCPSCRFLNSNFLCQGQGQRLLAADRIARLAADQIARLAADQIARLAADQIARLAADQIARLAADLIAGLVTDQIARLAADWTARLDLELLPLQPRTSLLHQQLLSPSLAKDLPCIALCSSILFWAGHIRFLNCHQETRWPADLLRAPERLLNALQMAE